MAESALAEGRSGKYVYEIYPLDHRFEAVPGNYIFSKQNPSTLPRSSGSYKRIYVGETSDLKESLSNHDKMACIVEHGATHILVHFSKADSATRQAEVRDLIANSNPPCNDE